MLSMTVARVLLITTSIVTVASTLETPVDNGVASVTLEDVAPSAVLGADDECLSADGNCALNALQRKSANLVVHEAPTMPVHVKNNANNTVLLANCQVSIALRPGSAVRGNMRAPGGFWVVPEDAIFNCSEGCADCFFVSTFMDPDNGLKVRIGFGLGMDSSVQPHGGGIIAKSGTETAECKDGDCKDEWTKNMTVDTTSGSEVEVVVLGTAEEFDESISTEPDDEQLGASWRRGHVHVGPTYVHVGPTYRRRGYYRPYYRPYRPYPYHPIVHTALCSVCIPYSCWWLCPHYGYYR